MSDLNFLMEISPPVSAENENRMLEAVFQTIKAEDPAEDEISGESVELEEPSPYEPSLDTGYTLKVLDLKDDEDVLANPSDETISSMMQALRPPVSAITNDEPIVNDEGNHSVFKSRSAAPVKKFNSRYIIRRP